jgi:hypothetical protein
MKIMDINDKLNKLSKKDKFEFKDLLMDVLEDRSWCITRGLNYKNPNVLKAKEILYREFTNPKIIQGY